MGDCEARCDVSAQDSTPSTLQLRQMFRYRFYRGSKGRRRSCGICGKPGFPRAGHQPGRFHSSNSGPSDPQIPPKTLFLESVVEYPDGWGFRFNYNSLVTSQQLLQGNWWNDWLASTCPALLLHGHTSWVLKTEHAREMASRRPNTRLVEFPDCGHTIHDASPAEFYKAVKEFLESITS